MADLQQFLEFQYQTIDALDEEKGVYLVRDCLSGQLRVKKIKSLSALQRYADFKGISEPGLVRILEVHKTQDSCIVIEEFVNGIRLDRLLERQKTLSEETAVDFTLQLCAALSALHQKGLVHRDVKPENIVVTTNGVLKLLDFDAVRHVSSHKQKDTVLMGSVNYAAPEQYGFFESDCRADIYAVGVLLNVMLTGQLPIDGIYKGNRYLMDMIEKCIQTDRRKRYRQIQEAERVLERKTEGYYAQKLYARLPGLSSEKRYVHFLAGLGYVSYFLILFVLIASFKGKSSVVEIIDTIYLILLYTLIFAVLSNVGGFEEKLLRGRALPAPIRFIFRILLLAALVILVSFIDLALTGKL